MGSLGPLLKVSLGQAAVLIYRVLFSVYIGEFSPSRTGLMSLFIDSC